MTVGILLVDCQYDFFPGGALAVAGGDEIVAPINALLRRHPRTPMFASRDWHPPHSKHFQERGGTWPPHCVQGTRGAAFHSDIEMERARVYSKGTDPENDAGYSAFEGTRLVEGKIMSLAEDLRSFGVDEIVIAGLATDYCVKATVLDALKNGFETHVFLPGVRAVNLQPTDGDDAIAAMRAAGAHIVESLDALQVQTPDHTDRELSPPSR